MFDNTGWQKDGSYIPCSECGWMPPKPHDGPGVPVGDYGTIHYENCPTIPHLNSEQKADLQRKLDESARARRRAEAAARGYVIG